MAGQAVDFVRTALAAFNGALANRDAAVATWFHRDALFIGSEPGEQASGREAIGRLFATILASPNSVQFEWAEVEARRQGRLIWFFADGAVVISGNGRTVRRPYGLTGVLEAARSGTVWRLFHGSEPWVE